MPRNLFASILKSARPGARRNSTSKIEPLEPRKLLSVTFNAPVTSQIAIGQFSAVNIASGDLNGDGFPDVVATRQNLVAQVFTSTNTGALGVGPIVAAGGTFLALGDFNGDKKLDIATHNGIYPGNGDGTFGPLLTGFALPANTVRMYAQDVNGDGKLDLVCGTFDPTTTTNINGITTQPTVGIGVLLGNGDGTFKPAVTSTLGSGATVNQGFAALAFGDFNKDTKLDIASAFGLSIGNGDGTFAAPSGLAFKGTPPNTPAFPSLPIFVADDFNGDGNLDLITLPSTANNGSVELFTGDGKGKLTDGGPIVVAANQTISALSSALLTTSGNSDLIAGISTVPTGSTNATPTADVAVMLNNGNGTFAAPELFTAPGPPVTIIPEDFNSDGNIDLLTMNSAVGSIISNTGVQFGATASVFLNAQIAAVVPVLSLRSSLNPAVVGDAVKYAANVSPPTTSGPNAAVPTGTVSFFNGTTLIGTTQLVKGKASIVTTASGLGAQSITFTYTGDVNYASATSTALSQKVLQTSAKVSLLVPAFGPITLPPTFLPGDKGTATITLTNGGAGAGNGKITVNFYLSTSGAIDSSAIQLPVPSFQNRQVHIASGQVVNLPATIKLPDVPVTNYFLVAQVLPGPGFTSDEINSTPLFSSTTFTPAGPVFGTVGTHHNLMQSITDVFGNTAVLSLVGPGKGTATTDNGQTNISITGTTTASRFRISSPGAFVINNVDVRSVMAGFAGPRTTLAGNLNLRGGVNHLLFGSAASTDGSPITITVGSSTFTPTIFLGGVGDVTLISTSKIKTVNANSWQAGAIDAPALATLSIGGAFGANVNIHAAGKIKNAQIGGIAGGTWAVAGGVQLLRVEGGVANANIFVGADSGPDNTLGTGDDAYIPAAIFSLFIGADVNATTIAAGVSLAVGQPIPAGISLLGNGAIREITLRGTISDDSRFIAPHLPAKVVVNGVKVATATDPHFQI